MDNKAKAFAQLHLHGRELEEIDDIEFKNTYRDSIGKKYSSNLEFREFTDFPCTCDSYSIDGYDSSTYVCKVKRPTIKEIKDIVSWISN